MSEHVLDRPVWSALTTRQVSFAIGDDRALRFDPEVAPFAATRDDAPESLAALEALAPVDAAPYTSRWSPADPCDALPSREWTDRTSSVTKSSRFSASIRATRSALSGPR
jgi:hypothetical protein